MNILTMDQQALELHNELKKAIESGKNELKLKCEEYHLRGNLLEDKFCFVSNNDHGLKRILFDFDKADNFILDGNGAHLVFYGNIMPFRIADSKNITIRNLTIDWKRPFFSQAIVTKTETNTIYFNIDLEQYPITVDRGRLVAYDQYGWQTNELWNMLCFNSDLKEVMLDMPENWHLSCYHKAEDLGNGSFKIEADFSELPCINTPVVFMHGNRVAPGIFIDTSKNINVEDVTIHHAPGMALVAQVSENVTLKRYNVKPSGDRLFSSWVDASHFVDCNGHILLDDCSFQGQFDDASNIHGAFWNVIEKNSADSVKIEILHYQQSGVMNILPGDSVAFHDKSTHRLVHIAKAVKVTPINKNIYDVTLDSVPKDVNNIIMRRYRQDTFVEIKNCHFGANRGRGLLLSMPGKILVESNYFHVDGSAIDILSDSKYWWEAGPVEDVEIKNNHFDDCGFGPCGKTLFHICPDLNVTDSSSIFSPISSSNMDSSQVMGLKEKVFVHKNIHIHNNKITTHNTALLFANFIDGITFKDNEIIWSEKYTRHDNGRPVIIGENTVNCDIQEVKV